MLREGTKSKEEILKLLSWNRGNGQFIIYPHMKILNPKTDFVKFDLVDNLAHLDKPLFAAAVHFIFCGDQASVTVRSPDLGSAFQYGPGQGGSGSELILPESLIRYHSANSLELQKVGIYNQSELSKLMHKNFVSNEAYKTETAKLGISYPKFSEFVCLYQPGVFEFDPDEKGQGMFQERLNLDRPTEIYSGPSFKSDNSPIDPRLVKE
jgi:hypothetical protein